jgi:thioredoxin 1
VRDVTDDGFEAEVLEAELPTIVDFWAPWCGPCRAIHPILEQLAEEHAGAVEVVKVNIDENPGTPSRYGVLSIPTVILFEGGEPKATVMGAYPRSKYETEFAAWLVQ